jgi:hypothetical protein
VGRSLREVLERLEMPAWSRSVRTPVGGGDQFFCGGGSSGKVRTVRRPRRGSAAAAPRSASTPRASHRGGPRGRGSPKPCAKSQGDKERYHRTAVMRRQGKGLEYHTVVFVGLDDGAWWSFVNDQQEAIGRIFRCFHARQAKRRLHLLCAARGARAKIAALYDVLTKAGVKTVKVG